MRLIRPISLLLLSLLLVHAAGPWLLFTAQRVQFRAEVKQRIKAGLPESQLVVVAIPCSLERAANERFRRVEENEFRYDGRMYDVVRAHVSGDTTYYSCIEDERESALFANLDQEIRRAMNGDPQRTAQAAQILRLLHSVFVPQASIDLAPLMYQERAFASPVRSLLCRPETPPAPPPKS